MPRSPRIHFDGARHHVMNRTARKRIVFETPEHIALFERLLAEVSGRFGARLHAWALMGNHFHLVVDAPGDRLAALMAWLTAHLARAINAEKGWDGPLFRGRYRNRVVLDDAYFRDVIAYVHLNPVQARLVAHPDNSVWTSHRFYTGQASAPAWMTTADLLAIHGDHQRYQRWMAEVVAGRRTLTIDADHVWTPAESGGAALAPPPPTVQALSAAAAFGQVAEITGIPLPELLTARRGRDGNPPRTLAAWWLTRAAGHQRADVATVLGMTPGAVGAAVHRVQHAEGQLAAWREALLLAWWGPMTG